MDLHLYHMCVDTLDLLDSKAVLLLLPLLLLQDLLDPELVQAGCCHPRDVAQLVTFRTQQQAAQRAGAATKSCALE